MAYILTDHDNLYLVRARATETGMPHLSDAQRAVFGIKPESWFANRGAQDAARGYGPQPLIQNAAGRVVRVMRRDEFAVYLGAYRATR